MATMVSDTVQRPAQLDFKLRSVIAPKYKHVKIPMNNQSSGSIAIQPTTSTTLEWKLPTQVYNLARSYISYSVTVPAQANSTYSIVFEDMFDLGNAVTFGSAGGVDLVNLQYAQNYTKLARKIGTPIEDFLGNDSMSGLYKSNSLASDNIVPGGFNRVAGIEYPAVDNYLESQYTKASELNAGGVPAASKSLSVYRQYPLSAFVGTLLGVDRDFYSPVEQYLRVQAGTGDKMGFITTALATPLTNTASIVGDIVISNIYLYLAVEQNPDIVTSMMEKYASGQLSFRIPYTTAFKNVGSAASAQTNIQIQLSQQYGKRLKRVLHSVWNPQEKWNTANDCANYNGEKVVSYQTFLDNMPLQDRILSCLRPAAGLVNSDDWLENKKFLEKRSTIISKESYGINWFHIDQFYEPHDKDGSLPEVNLDEGLLMNVQRQWLFSGLAGGLANAVHYTFAEFAREIAVTPTGPIFV